MSGLARLIEWLEANGYGIVPLSRPSDERVPCLCGADENPNGPRLDIVCPKHDGEWRVPESEAGQ